MSRSPLVLAVSALTLACTQPEQEPAADAAQPADAPQDRVALAMSAAPSAVSGAARIVDFDSAGNLVELRAGTNGWMCLPNDPGTPGDDPMCLDQAWQEWLTAFVNRTTPPASRLGIGYMFRGGLVPSNTDPFATEPAAGDAWVEDGPHLMVVAPAAQIESFTTDHASGEPYLMWKGTPYAHLMVPVGPAAGH